MSKPFADGHFYSPIVDINSVKTAESRIWPDKPEVLGIDFNNASHEKYLLEHFPKYLQEFKYPLEPEGRRNDYEYYINNPQFSRLDAPTLYIMLRTLQPKRMIEIGSGYSSLLTADVNRKFLNSEMEFICIEPYPEKFLSADIPGINRLIQNKVEDTPLSLFELLQDGDFLFIDSSHVSKTGSDVNHIYFEILPMLAQGVFIHIHDIFLPYDYYKEWVIQEGRSWNEQYLLQALLMYSKAFEVIFGCMYACFKFPELLEKLFGSDFFGGASFWIRKCE